MMSHLVTRGKGFGHTRAAVRDPSGHPNVAGIET